MWSDGELESHMNSRKRNKNRGYQQLRVWNDAIELYALTCKTVRNWPFELKKIASQSIASTDSIHRNIAEGYCRRSIKEYLQFLYIALGSAGESVSGSIACREAGQITTDQFEALDAIAYRLENRLLRLTEQIERKRDAGDWNDSLIVKEPAVEYGADKAVPADLDLLLQNCITA
jgi:four helix bundle protein